MTSPLPRAAYRDDVPDAEYISDYTWRALSPDFTETVARARKAGARGPLEYIGAGATGVVFCVGDRAYKVARPGAESMVAEEAEWFTTANQIPALRQIVARGVRWNDRAKVLTRECVRPKDRSHVRSWGRKRALWDIHQDLRQIMKPHGWGAPEFKEDSYIITRDRGPVLVDGSMPIRYGRNLVAYTLDKISGRRPRSRSSPSAENEGLVHAIQIERGQTIPPHIADRVLAKLGPKLAGVDNPTSAVTGAIIAATGLLGLIFLFRRAS